VRQQSHVALLREKLFAVQHSGECEGTPIARHEASSERSVQYKQALERVLSSMMSLIQDDDVPPQVIKLTSCLLWLVAVSRSSANPAQHAVSSFAPTNTDLWC
jgi:hypothetical protein